MSASITWRELDALNHLAEEVLHTLRFSDALYDDAGRFCPDTASLPGAIPPCLDFRRNPLFETLPLADLAELSLEEIQSRYLTAILPKAIGLMKQEALLQEGRPLSPELPDAYLGALFALRWKDNALLWVVQRQRASDK